MKTLLNLLKKLLSWVAKRRWEKKQVYVDLKEVNKAHKE